MNETPLEDTQESFLEFLECFGLKQPDETNFHPLKNLLKTQEADRTIMKILAMENTKYEIQEEKLQHYQTNYKKQSYPGTTQLSVTLE
jgi:hypothetical protein